MTWHVMTWQRSYHVINLFLNGSNQDLALLPNKLWWGWRIGNPPNFSHLSFLIFNFYAQLLNGFVVMLKVQGNFQVWQTKSVMNQDTYCHWEPECEAFLWVFLDVPEWTCNDSSNTGLISIFGINIDKVPNLVAIVVIHGSMCTISVNNVLIIYITRLKYINIY